MALIEIARFADLTEAQTAASALRASDIPVLVQNEHWGQTEFTWQIAMGGFRLWVPEEEAADARAFVRSCRTTDREALRWSTQPGWLSGIAPAVLSLFLFSPGGLAPWGWAVAAVRQKPTLVRAAVVLCLTVVAVALYLLFWYSVTHPAYGP